MEIINAVFYIKEEQRTAFLEAVQPLLASARAEAGCRGYHLYESTEEANQFLMIEKWVDQAAIEAHNQTPELQNLFKKMPEFAAKQTEITVTHQGE